MTSRAVGVVLVGGLLTLAFGPGPSPARGQGGGLVVSGRPTPRGFYEAPGFYGTSFGTPSYKSVRGYSEFASPYGAGYGYGYAPARVLPGPYGVGLWRSGTLHPVEAYGASSTSYRTFALPYTPGSTAVTPAFGVYAPAFGPTPPYPPSAYFGR